MDNKLISLFPYWGQNENELKYDADILYKIEGVISTNYHTQAKYVWIKGNDVYVAVSSEDNKPVQQAKIGDYYYDEIERANIITVTFDDKAKVNQEEAPGKNGSNECVWSIIKFSGAYSNFDLSDLNIYVNVQGNSSGTQGHELNITGKNLEMIAPEAPEVDIEDIDAKLVCVTDSDKHKDICEYKESHFQFDTEEVEIDFEDAYISKPEFKNGFWQVEATIPENQISFYEGIADKIWNKWGIWDKDHIFSGKKEVTFVYKFGKWVPVGENVEKGRIVLEYTHEEKPEIVCHTVTFKPDEHSDIVWAEEVTGEKNIEVENGKTINEIPKVVCDDGYTFVGWIDENNKLWTDEDILNMEVTKDMTFTAITEAVDTTPSVEETIDIDVILKCITDGSAHKDIVGYPKDDCLVGQNMAVSLVTGEPTYNEDTQKWEVIGSLSSSQLEAFKATADEEWGTEHTLVSTSTDVTFEYNNNNGTWTPVGEGIEDGQLVLQYTHEEGTTPSVEETIDIDVILKCITDGSAHKDIVGYPKDDCLVGQNMAVSLVTGEPTYNEDTQKWEVTGSLSSSQLEAFKGYAYEKWGTEHTLVSTSTDVTFEYIDGKWIPVGEGIENGQLVLQYTHEEHPAIPNSLCINVAFECKEDGEDGESGEVFKHYTLQTVANLSDDELSIVSVEKNAEGKWELKVSVSDSVIEGLKESIDSDWGGIPHKVVDGGSINRETIFTYDETSKTWKPNDETIVTYFEHDEQEPVEDTFTITFNAGDHGTFKDGTKVSVEERGSEEKGKEIGETPKIDIEPGYEFAGWKYESEEPEGEEPVIYEDDDVKQLVVGNDIEFTAVYRKVETPPVAKEYTVIFNAGDGHFSDNEKEVSTKVKEGSHIEKVPVATYDENNAFSHWVDENGKVYYTEDSIKGLEINSDKVFTAVYVDPYARFTVTFNNGSNGMLIGTNGEAESIQEEVLKSENVLMIPAVKANEEYKFKGWYMNDDTTKIYDDNFVMSYDIYEDTTFTAVYEKIETEEPQETVSVTFNTDGNGTLDGETEFTITKGSNVTSVPKATPNTGYEFKGWAINGNTGTLIDTDSVIKTTISENTTFTAIFELAGTEEPQETVVVTFDTDGNGTLDGETEFTITKGSNVTSVPKATPNTGYEFKGWAINGNTGTLIDTASVTKTTINENTTFTAIFELAGQTGEDEDSFTVTFNGGEYGTLTGETEYTIGEDGKITETPTVNPNTGYEFSGWYCEETRETYTEDELKDLDVEGDLNFTAQYEQITNIPDVDTPTSSGGGASDDYDVDQIFATPVNDDNDGNGEDGTTILDEDTALANLNLDDHFGYVVGYPDGTIRPNDYISREEVATIFFRLLDDESRAEFWSTKNSYSDTDPSDWSNNAVSTLEKSNIISGYTDGTFKGKNYITRAEFATIAARFDDTPYVGEDLFSDISGHWAEEYINRAANRGWIKGYEDGTFAPDQFITRAEAFTLINAVLGRTPSDSKLSDDMITFIDNPQGTWYYAQVQEATNSHNIEENTENGEVWTETVPMRDWKAIESPSNKNFIPDPYADDDVTTDDNSEDTTSDDVTE